MIRRSHAQPRIVRRHKRTAEETEREGRLRKLQEEAAARHRAERARSAALAPPVPRRSAPSRNQTVAEPGAPPDQAATSHPSRQPTPLITPPLVTEQPSLSPQPSLPPNGHKNPQTKAREKGNQPGGRPKKPVAPKRPRRPKAVHQEATSPERPLTPLEEAAEQFYLDREVRECTPATLRCYRYDLGQFLHQLGDHQVTRPEQITPQHIRLYLQRLQNRKLSPWTTHQHARVIRSFCNFLVSEELIAKSPMARVGMPRLPKELLPPFSAEEVQLLLEAAERGRQPTRDLALLLTLLDTGCRLSELLALQLGDINLGTGRVLVRQGKGRKDRVTFMGQRARSALKEYVGRRRRASDALWRTDEGEPLTKGGVREIFRRLSLRSGVLDVQAHKFRRTFAIWSLRAGMNIYSLQMLMGHSDLKTLQRYLALVEADLETAHKEHGAVDTMLA